MAKTSESLREELLETDDEFSRLYEQHQAHEGRLNELHQKSLLSEEDELEEKRLKREKLWLKDRMEAILRSRLEQQVSV